MAVHSQLLLTCAFCLLVRCIAIKCNVSYDAYGKAHADRTLFSCSKAMQDPKFPITNIKEYQNENLTVLTQLVLNNLIRIDEIENTAELDFYLRFFWKDTRWVFTSYKYSFLGSNYSRM